MFKSLLKSLIGLAILVTLLTGAWTLYLDPGILETSLDWKRVPQLGKQETAPVGIPEPLVATVNPDARKSTGPGPAWVRTPTKAPVTPAEAPPAVSPPPLAATEMPTTTPAPVTPNPQPEATPTPAQTEAPIETTGTPQTTVTLAPMPILIAKESAPPPSIPVEVATPAPMPATAAIEEPAKTPTPEPAPAVPMATVAKPALMQPEPSPSAAAIRGLTANGGPQMVPGPALAVSGEPSPASDTGPKATPAADALAATQDTPVLAKALSVPSSVPEPSPAADGAAAVEPIETAPGKETPALETVAPAEEEKVTADADPLAWSTLMAARRAAWEGRPGDAVALYRQLLEIDPDDFNAYGEMGNVLLHLRRPGEAAEAFKRAAGILIGRGDFAGANRLLPVIWQLDPEAGRQLQEQMLSDGRPAAPRQ